MDPFTLAMIAGAGINAIGKFMSGSSASTIDKMQAQAAGVQAESARTNASLLGDQADIAGLGVDFAASRERQALGKIAETGRSTLEAQRSYFAGGNLDPTFGSPLLVQAVTAGRIQTDVNLTQSQFAIDKANALTTEANIRGQQAGQTSAALNAMISGAAYGKKADADYTAGLIGAGTALLSGVAGFKGFGSGGGVPSGGVGLNLSATGSLY